MMSDTRKFGARKRSTDDGELGFVLLAVLFLVALILIGLAVAAPKMAKSIQRDKELELVHRGDQYRRAIKLYYRKFGSYPSSIDQLMNTNQVRFLRKRYKDPMTGKDDWKLVYFGQAHVQPMGLFGQSLAGAGMIGAAGGVGQPIAGAPNSNSTGAFGSSSGSSFGSSSGSSFGSSSGSSGSSFGSSSGSFGSSSGSSFGNSGSTGSGFGGTTGTTTDPGSGTATGGTDTGGGSSFGSNSGLGSSSGFGSGSGFGSSTGSATGTGTGSATGTGGAFGSSGSTGSTLGGVGPIVGVVIPDTRASIKEYKKQKHYNEWEFVYNPIEEQMQGAMGGGQQNLNGASAISGAGSTGFSSNIGGATLMNGGQPSSGLSGTGTTGSGTTGSGSTPQQ
jgi:type II secretory pathway pseudopilin PulG